MSKKNSSSRLLIVAVLVAVIIIGVLLLKAEGSTPELAGEMPPALVTVTSATTTTVYNNYSVIQPSSMINPMTCDLQKCPNGCAYTPGGVVCVEQVHTYTCPVGWAIDTNGNCVQIAGGTTVTNTYTVASTFSTINPMKCDYQTCPYGCVVSPEGIICNEAPNPIFKALTDFWNWLQCFWKGHCPTLNPQGA